MKKILIIILFLMVNLSFAQVKVTFSLDNRSISAGILSYDLIATVSSGQHWSVGAATIRLTIAPNPAPSLTIHPDNPVIGANPNISNIGGYQPLKTIAASATIISFNILNSNSTGFYIFNTGTYTLGKIRFNIVSTPFATDSIKFRVPPLTGITTVNDSLIALIYPTTFNVINPTITGTGINITEIPKEFKLYENYPNPFNPSTAIRYDIPANSFVRLVIYNITGKEISVLLNENKPAGSYETTWNGKEFASGVYFARLEAGSYKHIIKMLMVK